MYVAKCGAIRSHLGRWREAWDPYTTSGHHHRATCLEFRNFFLHVAECRSHSGSTCLVSSVLWAQNQMRQNIVPSGSSMAWNSVRRYLRHHNTSENSKSCSCWHEIFQVKQLTCLIWNPVPGKGFGWLSCQYMCITWYCAEVKMQIKERHLSQSRWDKIMKFKTRER